MHELSLMEGVLDIVRDSAAKSNIGKINKIKLVIGKLSMALPDSLQFAFQALGQEELFREAVLDIEERNVRCQCRNCQEQFEVEDRYGFRCLLCGSSDVDIVSGRELYVDYYEGE